MLLFFRLPFLAGQSGVQYRRAQSTAYAFPAAAVRGHHCSDRALHHVRGGQEGLQNRSDHLLHLPLFLTKLHTLTGEKLVVHPELLPEPLPQGRAN